MVGDPISLDLKKITWLCLNLQMNPALAKANIERTHDIHHLYKNKRT